MQMKNFSESEIETLAVDKLITLGFYYTPGPSIAPDTETTDEASLVSDHSTTYNEPEKRKSYDVVILKDILEHAINLLNPKTPEKARQEALKTVLATFSPQLIDANETFHKLLTEGVPVTVQKNDRQRGERIWLIDFQNPDNNNFYAINQFTIQGPTQNKRPDIILFINGLPLVIIELKNPADKNASIRKAYDQIQNYKTTIPSLLFYNTFCVISDGLEARAGTISSPFSRFQAWKTSDGKNESSPHVSQIETLIKGMLNKTTLLDIIRNFIVFEKDKKIDAKTGLTQVETVKKLAAYHQYYAVNKALASTRAAAALKGNRKAGVIWHTQGSGKSLTMVFYTGKLVHNLDNPTIIVITDRNDLDQQLFDTFFDCKTLLGQTPEQAESRDDLKKLLKVASGGIVFTTIHKFFPANDSAKYDLLSERRNIIVIADEAHRTQCGFKTKLIDTRDKTGKLTGKRITYGFAKFLRDAVPNATFIGFTGTPVESTDINTPAVFGHYIDIYDIAQSIEDGATVKIYYESRLAKINLTEEGRKLIEEFEKEITDDNTPETQQAKARWTKLESIIGHPERLKNLARRKPERRNHKKSL